MNAESIVALIALIVSVPISVWALVQAKGANARAAESNRIATEANRLGIDANGSARRSADSSERAASTAEEQTAIQSAIRRSSAEPALWADLRADERYGQLLRLVVGNSGPTVATRVTVTFDPPLTDTEMPSDGIHLGEAVLRHGLASLPPGRQVAWSGGFTGTFFTENAESPLSWEVTINADGPFGPLEPLTYTIDLKGLEQSNAAPPGTLHGVAEELKEVRKQLKTLTELGKAAYTVARERDRQPGSPEA